MILSSFEATCKQLLASWQRSVDFCEPLLAEHEEGDFYVEKLAVAKQRLDEVLMEVTDALGCCVELCEASLSTPPLKKRCLMPDSTAHPLATNAAGGPAYRASQRPGPSHKPSSQPIRPTTAKVRAPSTPPRNPSHIRLPSDAHLVRKAAPTAGVNASDATQPRGGPGFCLRKIPTDVTPQEATRLSAEQLASFLNEYPELFNTARVIAEMHADGVHDWHYRLRVDDETADIIGLVHVLGTAKTPWKNRGVGFCNLLVEPPEASLDAIRECYEEWSPENPWTYRARDHSTLTAQILLCVTRDDQ